MKIKKISFAEREIKIIVYLEDGTKFTLRKFFNELVMVSDIPYGFNKQDRDYIALKEKIRKTEYFKRNGDSKTKHPSKEELKEVREII